jgi:nucleotide-binding universal stress UspA family protein
VFEKIVLATDLSPAWDEIIACSGEFKALGVSEVILTHVITVLFLGGLEASLRAEAKPKLEEQRQFLQGQGFKVSLEMPEGLPAFSLNEVAQRHGADLIIVGSHGKSLWREAVLGCFTCSVLHHAEYPVLLLNVKVKEGMTEGACRIQATELLRHILFPTDFSMIAERARAYVEFLATKGESRVTLLNALDVPGHEKYPEGYQEIAEGAARDLLEQWRQGLLKAGVPAVNNRFDRGHPIPAILQALKSQDISLVVMGTQGKGFIKEIFLGSVAHNVSRLVPCPLLLIPPAAR